MNMLIKLIVMITSHLICVPKHHLVHVKYIQFSFVNHTTIKLENITYKDTRIKTKRMENRYNMYPSKKTTGVALVISDKSECKEITITRYKE